MDLGDFKTLLRDEVNKGTLHDATIAGRIRMAARWFERNYKLRYLHRWVSFIIDAQAAEPRLITPPLFVRSYEFFRLTLASGEYQYLTQVKAIDVGRVEEGVPTRFWTDGDESLVLEKTPKENHPAEIGYWRYTDWNILLDSQAHWLLDNGEDAMLAQTMLLMAPFLRESTAFMERYKLLRDESLSTIITADEEFAHGGAEDPGMRYHGN